MSARAPTPVDGRRGRRLLVRLVLSAAVVALLVRCVPWEKLAEAFSRVPPATFAAATAAFLLCHAFGAMKWRMVIAAAGASLPRRAALSSYSAGLFANLFLPSIVGGDLLRGLLAGRRSGRMEAALLGGATDRLLDLAALGLLVAAASSVVGLAQEGARRTLLLLAAGLAVAVGIAAAALLLRRPLAKWPRKLRPRIAQALVALRRARRRPGVLAAALLGAVAMQGALVAVNALLAAPLELGAGPSAWLFCWGLAKLAGLAPVSFNGIGVRDGAFALLMTPLIAGDALPREDAMARALAASLLWQAMLAFGSLIAGAGYWAAKRAEARAAATGGSVGHG